MERKTIQRVEAVFEVMVAGFGGWVLIMLVLGLTGLQGSDILSRPVWIAVALMAEATITLFLIRFLESSSYPLSNGVFGLIRWSAADLLIGAAAVPFLFLVVFFSSWMFELFFPQYVTDGNPLLEMIRTPLDLAAFLVAGVYAGGIKEEVQRAFILLRFEMHLGGISAGLVLWSLVFGLGHYEQGWSSAFSAAVLGLVFGGIFLWKRNLFTAISVHAVYDVTVLVIYWNYFRN
ncbi:MAG: CPBP family intramembrane glutamic endopeptidase [Acidobacteriota bacterium]